MFQEALVVDQPAFKSPLHIKKRDQKLARKLKTAQGLDKTQAFMKNNRVQVVHPEAKKKLKASEEERNDEVVKQPKKRVFTLNEVNAYEAARYASLRPSHPSLREESKIEPASHKVQKDIIPFPLPDDFKLLGKKRSYNQKEKTPRVLDQDPDSIQTKLESLAQRFNITKTFKFKIVPNKYAESRLNGGTRMSTVEMKKEVKASKAVRAEIDMLETLKERLVERGRLIYSCDTCVCTFYKQSQLESHKRTPVHQNRVREKLL